MKGLTLTQPYATLIALLEKDIETRGWRTDYRGSLAIHAGQSLRPVGGVAGLYHLVNAEPFASVLERRWVDIATTPRVIDRSQVVRDPSYVLPRGAIVAVARLVDCRPIVGGYEHDHLDEPMDYRIGYVRDGRIVALTEQERAFGDYTPGRFAWLLADVRPLRVPVPCRGAQGLWAVPAGVRAAIEAQLTTTTTTTTR